MNWKTTVSSVVTAFLGFVVFSPDLFEHWLVQLAKYGMAGGLIAFGIVAADAKKGEPNANS